MNGNIVIVGDINIDWLKTNGSERKRFYNILETFGFVQNICTETHRGHHLLDYIITRKDYNSLSTYTVQDFISDHRVLHAFLQCIRPHQVRKQIAVIWDDALAEDLDKFNVDQGCVNVDIMIERYDKAPYDTAYKLCKLCRTFPSPQQYGPDLTFLGHAGHADPLDGWICC